MFKLKSSNVIDETVSTIIGEGITIQNAVVLGSGAMRIDGSLSGTVNLESNIILSQSGKMKGDVVVKNAIIAGEMSGNITAENTVHLSSTGKLKGNIRSKNLVIDEGAKFNGEVHMDVDGTMEKSGVKAADFNNATESETEK